MKKSRKIKCKINIRVSEVCREMLLSTDRAALALTMDNSDMKSVDEAMELVQNACGMLRNARKFPEAKA